MTSYIEAMRAKGHTPIVDSDGDVDFFYLSTGHCNGPGCQTCHWVRCEHCISLDQIPICSKSKFNCEEGKAA